MEKVFTCKVSHSDRLRIRLLNDGNSVEQVVVLGELLFDHLQKVHIDVVDDLDMAREKVLDQRYRPLLKRLLHDSVVGVAEGRLHN